MIAALTLLLVFQLVGEVVARALALPIPGPVIGMALLFLTLLLRGGPGEDLRVTSGQLLQHLSLLFVPAGTGIVIYGERIAAEWLPLLVALDAPEGAEAIAEGEQLGIVQRRGRMAGEPFYALHALVAERALTRLADMGLSSVSVRLLLTRCAHWWHVRGEVYRAIRTALEGDDARLASTYLTSYAHQLVQGEGRHETFLDLLAQLESRSVEPDCALMLQAVWALVFLRRYAEAAAWLARIERACGKGQSAGVRLILHTTVLQRGVIAGLRDDEANAPQQRAMVQLAAALQDRRS